MSRNSNRSDAGTARESVHLDWREEGTAVVSIVNAIAALTGTPPTELEPLYDTIDPDALDAILDAPSGGPCLSVSFCHAGCDVTISGDGRLTVTLRTDDP